MDERELAKIVNSSGFPFQLAVEQHIRDTEAKHGWTVVAREYPWRSADETRSGFIDLIAERNTLHCVIECKRTQGGQWVFLVPETSSETLALRTLWSYVKQDARRIPNPPGVGWGWDDLHFDPPTLEAEFCILRGGDDGKPLLERIAGDLVRSAESLAREELGLKRRGWGAAAYVPTIVTNTPLKVCRVDPAKVDLATGFLPPSVIFQEVGAIRFRKALPSDKVYDQDSYDSIASGLKMQERNTFVVHVGYLETWLTQFQEPLYLHSGRKPWHLLERDTEPWDSGA